MSVTTPSAEPLAHALLTRLLAACRGLLGRDHDGYANHCHRVVTFCLALRPSCTDEEQEKIAIAVCFHDLGLWTDNTLDYLPPSVVLAVDYLQANGREAWAEEVALMVSEHHKARAVTDTRYPLVEVFRQADLVDFSLGAFTAGLPRDVITAAKARYPNAGFHAMLMRRSASWLLRHPLNPLPMMKW